MKSHDFCLRISWKIAKGNVWAKFYVSTGCGSCINKGFLILCTTLHRNPMQASNFGGTLTNFSFEVLFNKMFTEDASLLFLNRGAKKKSIMTKNSNQGGSLGLHQWTKIRWKPSSGETSGHLFMLLSRPLNLRCPFKVIWRFFLHTTPQLHQARQNAEKFTTSHKRKPLNECYADEDKTWQEEQEREREREKIKHVVRENEEIEVLRETVRTPKAREWSRVKGKERIGCERQKSCRKQV